MDISRALITKIVDEGKINEVKRAGIQANFLDDDTTTVYNYIHKYWTTYKEAPTRNAVLQAFPNFEFIKAVEPIEFYIDQLKENYRRQIFESALEEAAGQYLHDTTSTAEILRKALSDVRVTNKSQKDLDIAEEALSSIERYEKKKLTPGPDGILSGWKTMDKQTLGWKPEQFIVLVGEKHIGKSWIMVWLAYQAALQGERVLFITEEMSQEVLQMRVESMYASVPFDSLRSGELTHYEEKRYKEKMQELHKKPFKLMVAREGVYTVDDFETKIVETDADICFVDSVYLFPPSTEFKAQNETQKRMEISHRCKKIATTLQIPLIVSVQAGRKQTKDEKPTLDSIEWSNSFSQDCTVAFHIEKTQLDIELKRAHIYVLKLREGGQLCDFYINVDAQSEKFDERPDEIKPTTQVFDDEDKGIFYDNAI